MSGGGASAPVRHPRRRLVAAVVVGSWLALPARASAEPDPEVAVQRVKLAQGQTRFVPVAGLVSVVVTDPSRAGITARPGGFSVEALRTGDVVVQAFTAAGMRVFVIAIGSAPKASQIRATPTSDDFGQHEAVRTAWGVNRYDLKIQRRTGTEAFATHALSLTGKLGGGDHRVDTAWTSTGLTAHELTAARASWISEDRQRSAELGDVAPEVVGSKLVSGTPLLGAKARIEWRPTWAELALGSLRSSASRWRFDRPAVGIALGHRLRAPDDVALGTVVGNVLGYQSGDRSGFYAGSSATALVRKRTLVEARASLVGATSPSGASQAGSAGATASYVCPTASYAAEYEGNSGGYAQPASEAARPASHRASASASRRLQPWLTGAASISQVRTREGAAGFSASSTLSTALFAALGAAARLGLTHSETMMPRPSLLALDPAGARPLHRRQTSASASHQLDPESRIEGHVTHAMTRYEAGKTSVLSGLASASRHRKGRWMVQGSAALGASRRALGEEAAPLTIQSTIAASAQVFRGPLQLSASAAVQQILAPTAQTGLSTATAVRFTPTTATQLSVAFEANRDLAGGPLRYGATLGVTHYFGDAVRSRPLLQSLADGAITGTLCIDLDADGECQRGEARLEGVAITLSSGRRTETGRDGGYRFDDVAPGAYTLEVDEEALRRRGRMTTASKVEILLESGEVERTSFAITTGCEIVGSVLDDLDMSGGRTDPDTRIANVGITIAGRGRPVETRTDGMGMFRAVMPRCGAFVVSLDPGSLPESMTAVSEEVPISVTATEGRASVELLAFAIRAVQGRVFDDANRNGRLDPGEAIVPGATVRWAGGAASAGDDGGFLLRRLPAGRISLQVDPDGLPPGATPGEPVELELGPEPVARDSVDLPIHRSAPTPREVRGRVYQDQDRDGVRDPGEPIVAGARVRWAGGAAITDRAGTFRLADLPAGRVKLSVDFARLPAGMVPGRPVELTIGHDGGPTGGVDLAVNPIRR